MIGPPNVPSDDLPSRSGLVILAVFCRGVSSIQLGLLRFSRKLPLNVLPPLLVTMLMTPPEKRPYSAEMRAGQDVRLLNRVFDEEVVRGAEQVVVDVDAVDHEHVVERGRAGNVDLADVRRVAA